MDLQGIILKKVNMSYRTVGFADDVTSTSGRDTVNTQRCTNSNVVLARTQLVTLQDQYSLSSNAFILCVTSFWRPLTVSFLKAKLNRVIVLLGFHSKLCK